MKKVLINYKLRDCREAVSLLPHVLINLILGLTLPTAMLNRLINKVCCFFYHLQILLVMGWPTLTKYQVILCFEVFLSIWPVKCTHRCSLALGPWDSRPSQKSVMLTQTVYLFVTYSCSGFNFEHFFISFSNTHVQFQGCWHKKQQPLCMTIMNSDEKILFIILAMISISKMKNSVYNLIDFCTCDWVFLLVEVTKDWFSMKLVQIYHKVTDCCIWPNLYCWEMNIRSQN